MNIALIETHAVPGVWKYDLSLAREIATIGHSVTIVTSKAFPDIDPLPPGVRIVRLFPNLRAHSTFIVKGLLYLVATLRAVWHVYRGGFQMVHWQHFNTFPPAEMLMATLLRFLRQVIVITVHDVDAWSAVRGQSNTLLKLIYGSAHGVIVHHEINIGELVSRYGVDESRIDVVPHGSYVDFQVAGQGRAASREVLDIPVDARVVLFFGEIRPEKGLIHLIRAIGRLRNSVPGLLLVIAGRPRHMDMSDCLQTVTDLGIESLVSARIEYIDDDDVQRYFSAADVIAIPYTAITQSGILFEAMTAGRPIVATDVGAVGPTVREADVGLVVPPGDEIALAGAIQTIFENSEDARRMSENGLRESLASYSWSSCAKKTVAIYEHVAPGKPDG